MKNVLQVGKTYQVKNRVKTIVAIGLNEDYFNGDKEVVIYTVKDGSERYETKEAFEAWVAKA